MTATGTFRVYFNRHGAAPLVWCIATSGWELAVSQVMVNGRLCSVYEKKAEKDEDDGRPSAWFEVTGTMVLVGSIATITAKPVA